jgi:hypothetical protein
MKMMDEPPKKLNCMHYKYTLLYIEVLCFLGTHQRMVTHCFLGGLRKSLFVLRSKIQTTPTTRKDIHVTHNIIGVNGLRKLEFNFHTGATTTSPDSIYGCMKSTIFDQLGVIVMSPTTASSSYMEEENL